MCRSDHQLKESAYISGIEDEYDSVEGDVQKKIVPWNCMLPEEDLDPELQADYNQKRQRSTGLVLVTSLINKVPNLGGSHEFV